MMAYVMDNVLKVVNVDPATGQPFGSARALTVEPADQLSWSGDSLRILFDSAGALQLISVNGGAPKTVPVNLTWKPQACRRARR